MTLIAITIDSIGSQLHALSRDVTEVLAAPKAPVPPVGTGNPPFGGKISTLLGWLRWLVLVACIAGIFITGGRMAIAWRGGNDANVAQLGWVMLGCILVGTASQIVGALI